MSQFNVNPYKNLPQTKTLNIQDRFSTAKIWVQHSGQEIILLSNSTARLLTEANQIIIYFTYNIEHTQQYILENGVKC